MTVLQGRKLRVETTRLFSRSKPIIVSLSIIAVFTALSVIFLLGTLASFEWKYVPSAALTGFAGGVFLLVLAELFELIKVAPTRFYVSRFATTGAIVGFSTLPTWFWYGSANISSDFFATVAQVLPVVVLGSVVDLRNKAQRPSEVGGLIAIAGFGEFICLTALAFDPVDSNRFPFAITVSSLTAAFVALAVQLVYSSQSQDKVKSSDKDETNYSI